MEKQVKVIIINKSNKYLLIKRKDTEKLEHFGNWECPGGKLEKHESFEEAGIREVKEEVNLNIKILSKVKEIKKDNEINAVVFLGTPVSNNEVELSDEHSEFRWFSYDELKELNPITYKDFFLKLIKISRT